jgi:dynein heavy chain 1
MVKNYLNYRENSKETFGDQMETLVGDAFLSAAYLSYAGIFDQSKRSKLWATWQSALVKADIKFNSSLMFTIFLTNSEERKRWNQLQLPQDLICQENAVILDRSERFPLIIDPSGQALAYLLALFEKKNISITSFHDPSYLKTIESAVRFGNTVIVRDAEHYDSILDSILNKDIRKSGGRSLCRLGKRDIDYASNFRLFLITKDSVEFSADICSKLTLVNFTITPGSLASQCLDVIMKSQRADVDEKRLSLMKLQGEYQYQLHVLEKELLDALNESEGNILEDLEVMAKLENLKVEAEEISAKSKETDEILDEVQEVTSIYRPLAVKFSAAFFAIEKLSRIEYFYQYSLEMFFSLLSSCLEKKYSTAAKIEQTFFTRILGEICVSLRQDDIPLISIILARIKTSVIANIEDEYEWSIFLSSHVIDNSFIDEELCSIFGVDVGKAVQKLCQLKSFTRLKENIFSNRHEFSTLKDDSLDRLYRILDSFKLRPFQKLLVTKCILRNQFLNAINVYLSEIFGESFVLDTEDKKIAEISSTNSSRPILICSAKGHDISHRIEALAKLNSKSLLSIAMGSSDGINMADTVISQGIRSGSWVIIKNAHLAMDWLNMLEKKLPAYSNSKMKLFITTELHPKFPLGILRESKVLIFEPASGLCSSVLQSADSIPIGHFSSGPVEKYRVMFMLSWLHGIILERLRYVPMGWSNPYEFNDSDLEMALSIIDKWFRMYSKGRRNLSPEKIPWEAFQCLLTENIYGGKIHSEDDSKILKTLVAKYISPKIFDSQFVMAGSLKTPTGLTIQEFKQWVKGSMPKEDPSWFELGSKSNIFMKSQKTDKLISNLKVFSNWEITNEHNATLTTVLVTDRIKELKKCLSIVIDN